MDIERIFTSDTLRIGLIRENVKLTDGIMVVASKDRSEKRIEKWVINHLSMDEAGVLKDSLVALLEEGEKDA
ncbi:hypothetical protein DW790_05705 [Firmicutes bacterium AM31-12AC]|nr:hypothetical protein DW790_05705 [Firmicutes bacterium AM31-12AC]